MGVAELWKQGFDNKIESCCFDGFWILYGGDSFNNATSIQESWWGFGSSYCTDVPTQFRNRASSLRYVGFSHDWVGDSLNLYTRENYGGMTRVTTEDEGRIDFQPGFDTAAQSAIVTGCTPWTLYEYDYYLGNSICLPAGQMATDTGSCEPAFYNSNSSLGLLAGEVSSMKKGCWTQQSHSIHCYDYTGQGGDQFRTNDVVAELSKQSFDNKIESCCFDGFWILYGGDSFNNATSIQESWRGFGSSYCTDVPTQFRNRASSLRYVGFSHDWVGDSHNLYTRENYGGMTRVTTEDEGRIDFQPGFDNAAQSAIVTGCTPWTLY